MPLVRSGPNVQAAPVRFLVRKRAWCYMPYCMLLCVAAVCWRTRHDRAARWSEQKAGKQWLSVSATLMWRFACFVCLCVCLCVRGGISALRPLLFLDVGGISENPAVGEVFPISLVVHHLYSYASEEELQPPNVMQGLGFDEVSPKRARAMLSPLMYCACILICAALRPARRPLCPLLPSPFCLCPGGAVTRNAFFFFPLQYSAWLDRHSEAEIVKVIQESLDAYAVSAGVRIFDQRRASRGVRLCCRACGAHRGPDKLWCRLIFVPACARCEHCRRRGWRKLNVFVTSCCCVYTCLLYFCFASQDKGATQFDPLYPVLTELCARGH